MKKRLARVHDEAPGQSTNAEPAASEALEQDDL